MRLALQRLFPFLLVVLAGSEVQAQSARLRAQGFTGDRLSLRVGQSVTLEIFADLQGVEASGFSLYVSLPDGPFQVIDADTFRVGTQPFVAGPLFSGAGENRNILYSEEESPYNVLSGLQLQYAAVFGQGQDRRRTGSGVVASFKLRCIKPVLNGKAIIDDNPVLETFLTLSDGVTIERFRTIQGLEITVSGISLRDIPDVVLLPDRADSTTIGILDNYLENILSPVDSIRWSFEPASLDSVEIRIDPATRRVKITPAAGWHGRRQVVWTATESQGLLPGEPPLSASDASRIVVNNPPQFTRARGPDGVRRDTIRFREDEHPYLPGAIANDQRRAFRGEDLDFLVQDLDVLDPEIELDFAVLLYDSGNLPGTTGDDATNHELLVWSRPDFAGLDSFKVVVRDALRGEDSLRVIVIVEEVPDAPRFLLADRTLRIGQGGQRSIALEDFVEDVDTPLDSLLLDWDDDPGGNFTAEIAGDSLVFKGKPDFLGEGLFVFRVADPLDPENLKDRMVVNIVSSKALPPVIRSGDLKICLTPPGVSPALPPFVVDLDDLVDDPDNQDGELLWENPFLTHSVITIDPKNVMTVAEPLPLGFVGYEGATLTATDPGGQSDFLNLRIYSSDRSPVAGGLPDLALDLGQVHDTIDLDNYYCDSNNLDEEMLWQVDVGDRQSFSGSFAADDFSISIDPLTHVVTLVVAQSAVARTETVVFQVTSRPEGISSQDTMLVTINAGGTGTGAFRVKPLGVLEVLVDEVFTLDLDEFVLAAPEFPTESLQWAVVSKNSTHSIAQVDPQSHELKILGLSSGIDTLSVTARDQAGRSQTLNTTVRVLGESEVLKLQSIPDIQFISGQSFTQLHLNPFVVDRQAHPDSVLVWTVVPLATSPIIVQVRGDSVVAVSFDVAETEVVFVARDTLLNATGRDTVRVFALDPASAAKALKDIPPVTFATGQEDSSIALDPFLPEGTSPLAVRWSVSGQRITSPFIDPRVPHTLHLRAVGNSVGIDTLKFVADLGGGFTARGNLVVTVSEPVDETTLHLEVIPNPFNPEFIDVFVVARRQLAGTPNVVRSFEGSDSTVAVRQIEEDLAKRGALIWSGNVRLRPQAAGTVFFTARATTALGTGVLDTASVAIAPVVAGKPVALEHGGVRLWLPAGAAQGAAVVLLQTGQPEEEGAAKAVAGEEPELRRRIDLYPAGLRLQQPGELRLALAEDEGVYYWQGGEWVWVGNGPRLEIARLGRYAVRGGREERELAAVAVPRGPWLGANYPNPFNPETAIQFAIPLPGRVRLSIYSIGGQRVRELVDETRAAGTYQVRWDGRSDAGERVGSGVYLYRLESGGVALTRRMMLVK